MTTIGSLFSGYGGLDLAARDAFFGARIAWHVERDANPSRILAHHYPSIPNHGDVTRINWADVEPVDILTGGYPCQPFSQAGLRKGTDDERHLWPYVLDAIRQLRPRYVLLENVRGHLTLGFDAVLSDLARVGWAAVWGIVRASDAGAPHQRARLFILAYPNGGRREQSDALQRILPIADADGDDAADSSGEGREGAAHAGSGGRGLPRGGAAADSYIAGGEAWGYAGSDSEWAWAQPLGSADAAPHPRGHGHGEGQDTRGMGRLDGWAEREAQQRSGAREKPGDRGRQDWGQYEPAIRRWEAIIGRPAPGPTEPGRNGRQQLAPRFVEWMMGLPEGWVTAPEIGLSRTAQLTALGNGVVPQQAALAARLLLQQAASLHAAAGHYREAS